ncbi:uncharacterized protein EI90DRAFT_3033489 [Cantharellus anzutake]|uniref:uncharacterized protein n=1 Tax=Cantharellus anzutake TaxID=1750568 RepID=UPI001904396A|nr:uncharacterized protein EI90DRAFT_3033489 [Cantharellus anzutake]KAF8341313.1 hypothetical protein EI90DRAFT_3033489 [Cantharellus anzutake]
MQLSFKDIYVDFLPEGMERRTQNSSRFDFRTRSIYLTLELKVHPPRASNASSFKLLIQNNNLGSQFHTLLSNHFYSSSPPDKSLDSWPSWILELIDSLPVTPTPAFLSQYPPQPREISANVFGRNLGPSAHFSNGYYQIDTSQTLAQILRDREFLEFPTFELFATYPSLNEILIIAESPDIDVIKRPAAKRPRIEQHPEFVDHMLGGYGSTDNEGDPAQDRDQTDDEDVGVDILGYGTDNDNLGETRFSEEYDVGEIGEAESEIPGVLGDGTESDSSSVWSSGVEDDVTDLITDQ